MATRTELLQGSEVQRQSAYSEVRWRLIEVWGESQRNRLVLEVQGRLAWGKQKETMEFMYVYHEKYDKGNGI